MIKFKDKMIKLVEMSGGTTEQDLFVTDIGVSLVYEHQYGLTVSARQIFNGFNIKGDNPFLQIAEFASRLTYLSFTDQDVDSSDYHNKMINEYGHLSPYAIPMPCVLVAGCSIETVLEFVAHHEASVARLTSSMTKAMSSPLFYIDTEDTNFRQQMSIIKDHFNDINNRKVSQSLENRNKMMPSCKAGAFLIGMSIKDWHKTFIGRLSKHGVEKEVQVICKKILKELKPFYSEILKNEEEYYVMGNNKKYEI